LSTEDVFFKLGVRLYTQSLKFCQNISLYLPATNTAACRRPPTPHFVWLHSAARLSLCSMEKCYPCGAPLADEVRRVNITLLFFVQLWTVWDMNALNNQT